jgi:hypothetical protein
LSDAFALAAAAAAAAAAFFHSCTKKTAVACPAGSTLKDGNCVSSEGAQLGKLLHITCCACSVQWLE